MSSTEWTTMLINCMQATWSRRQNESKLTRLHPSGEDTHHRRKTSSLSHHEVNVSLLDAKVIHQPLKTMLLLTHLEHKHTREAHLQYNCTHFLYVVTHTFYCCYCSQKIKYHVSLSIAVLPFDLISLNPSVCPLYHFPPCHKSQCTLIFCSEKAFQAHKNNPTQKFLLHANTNRFVHLQQQSLLIFMGRKSP